MIFAKWKYHFPVYIASVGYFFKFMLFIYAEYSMPFCSEIIANTSQFFAFTSESYP